jgi:hypothetical protein
LYEAKGVDIPCFRGVNSPSCILCPSQGFILCSSCGVVASSRAAARAPLWAGNPFSVFGGLSSADTLAMSLSLVEETQQPPTYTHTYGL